MTSNCLFFIFLISFALIACNSSPKDKKSCFVEIEVEYSEEHDNMFNQFSDLFEDSSNSIENPKINAKEEEVVEEEEMEEDDENTEDSGDEYTKVEHLIPSNIKNNCLVESVTPSNYLIKNFKKLCMNYYNNFSFHSIAFQICPALCQTNYEFLTYFVLELNNIYITHLFTFS